MPTYEYKCNNCGHKFEYFQSIADEALENCPICEGPVKRIIYSGAGVIFKGKGFYSTDYRNDSPAVKTRCGNEKTCCGRDIPCEKPSCD